MQQITSYQTKKADFVLSSSFSLYFKPSILNNTGSQALKQVALPHLLQEAQQVGE